MYMKLARYECEDEGIFTKAIDLIHGRSFEVDHSDKEKLKDIMKYFDDNLIAPKLNIDDDHIRYYFTEKGISKFRKYLDDLIFTVNRCYHYPGINTIEITLSDDDNRIMYKDKYQVVLN